MGLSLPAWGAWIEIMMIRKIKCIKMSLPAWGAWIEIRTLNLQILPDYVAPRVGSVD